MRTKNTILFSLISTFFLIFLISIWKILATLQGLSINSFNIEIIFIFGFLISLAHLGIGDRIKSIYKKKGGNINTGVNTNVCNTNSFMFAGSCINWVHLLSLIGLIIEIPLTIYIYQLVRKNIKLKIDWKTLLKYLLSSILIFTAFYFLINQYLEYKISIFEFLPELVLWAIIIVVTYVGLTYLIDNNTRKLFKGIMKEFVKRGNN